MHPERTFTVRAANQPVREYTLSELTWLARTAQLPRPIVYRSESGEWEPIEPILDQQIADGDHIAWEKELRPEVTLARDGDEAETVQEKAPRGTDAPDEQSRDRRPNHTGAVDHGAVQRNGIDEKSNHTQNVTRDVPDENRPTFFAVGLRRIGAMMAAYDAMRPQVPDRPPA
jgi:hypothetical protein